MWCRPGRSRTSKNASHSRWPQHRAAGRGLDRAHQPHVVGVEVGDDEVADVAEREARLTQRVLQRRQRRAMPARAAVDQHDPALRPPHRVGVDVRHVMPRHRQPQPPQAGDELAGAREVGVDRPRVRRQPGHRAASRSIVVSVTPRSRRTCLRTFAVGVLGRASNTSKSAGRRSAAAARRTTRTAGPVDRRGQQRGRPSARPRRRGSRTAARPRRPPRPRRAGSRTSSTSAEAMFSPRRRMRSLMRSTKYSHPSASCTSESPVWNHRLR